MKDLAMQIITFVFGLISLLFWVGYAVFAFNG